MLRFIIVISLALSACSSKQKKSEKKEAKAAPPPAEVQVSAGEESRLDHYIDPKHHWSYSGELGPESWGQLQPEFSACRDGREQSPIDLKWKKPSKGRDLAFQYKEVPFSIENNGHTIQVNFAEGNALSIGGQEYRLLQMHFHTPSEHRISGKSYPMELHFVHKNDSGQLAVIGIFFREGALNPVIEKIWSRIPAAGTKELKIEGDLLDPGAFIPSSKHHYTYAGSLTTPPCTEGVNWNVLNTPLEMSPDQIAKFQGHYPANARPTQSVFDRSVLNY